MHSVEWPISYYANNNQALISLNTNEGFCSTVPITVTSSYLTGSYPQV